MAVRMLPTRLPGTFRQVVPPPAAAHRQRVGFVAAAALILALAALSIRLTLASDLVVRFSHMGYVGGFVYECHLQRDDIFAHAWGAAHTGSCS